MMRTLIANMPFVLVRHLEAISLMVPYYHLISDAPVLHVKHLFAHKSVREFTKDLEFLQKHYRAIGLPDLLEALRRDQPLPKRSFLLTFDDGFREMSDVVAPLLLAKGIPAVFFVGSAFTDNRQLCYQHTASVIAERLTNGVSPAEVAAARAIVAPTGVDTGDLGAAVLSLPYGHRSVVEAVARAIGVDTQAYLQQVQPYLTSPQITALVGQGFAIGGHSIDHPLYAALPLQEQLRQTRESIGYVKRTYGLDYAAFAFPHHDRGVSRQFFTELYDRGELDVSFGTGGPSEDVLRRNIQRISFERPRVPAQKIVVYAAARRIYRSVAGGARLTRQ